MSCTIGGAARIAAAGLLAAAVGMVGCSEPLPRKETLARLQTGFVEGSAIVSSDLRHTAFTEKVQGGRRVVADGRPGRVYDWIVTRSFAPGTDRPFYWTTRAAADGSEEAFLVADGTPHQIGRSRHEYLVFTPDGRRWAAVATIAATAAGPPPDDRRVLVLADGQEQGRWMDASVPAFTADGAHVTWLVADQAPAGEGRRRLLVDGSERASFSSVPARCVPPIDAAIEGARLPRHERVVWLSDGGLVALVRDGEGWTLRRDGAEIGRYAVNLGVSTGEPVLEVTDEACTPQPAIASGSLVAAATAPAAFWWERRDGRWRVVRDGVPVDDVTCERAWDVQPPVVSDDGQSWAYACVARTPVTGQEVLVVTPRGRYGPYREVWTLALSDDGRRVAYGASPEGGVGAHWFVYADGVPYPPRYHAVWRPRFDRPYGSR